MKVRPRLGYVILYVEDVLDVVSFYQRAFGLEKRFLHESNQYAEMETGQTCLAFASEKFVSESHQFRENRLEKQAAGAEIAFIVEDVEGAFQHAVEVGAAEVSKPVQKPWGQTVSYVRDNNGFIVEICDAIT
ncbi:MAG: VOC family protein [Simkaniaceae bacterium]|nr:VOC family protein [Candidatus Sacchlamyda saccharinae]